jgi:hypothetical protein
VLFIILKAAAFTFKATCLLDVIFSGSMRPPGIFYPCVIPGDTAHCRDEVL